MLSPLPAMSFLADMSHRRLFEDPPNLKLQDQARADTMRTSCSPSMAWALRADSQAWFSHGSGLTPPSSAAHYPSHVQSPPSTAGSPANLSAAFDSFHCTEEETEVQSGRKRHPISPS